MGTAASDTPPTREPAAGALSRPAVPGPLAGVRVVELSTTIMGPYCGLLLAELGAEVVKLEAPTGDIARQLGVGRSPGMSAIYLNANRGKRSVAIDLKHPRAAEVIRRLLRGADVFLHNFRPASAERLGLGSQAVRAIEPAIIYCAGYGYGQGGRYRDEPAYDDVIQAASGIAALQGRRDPDGDPCYVVTNIVDKTVGSMMALAIVAALVRRGGSGVGSCVEVPMLESAVFFGLLEQMGGAMFDPPIGRSGYPRTASPHRRPYRTSDGHVAVMVYTDRHWRDFFALVGHPGRAEDPRYATAAARTEHIDELYGWLADELARRPTAWWLERLRDADIPASPVNDVEDVLADPHVRDVGLFERREHPSEGWLHEVRLPFVFDGEPLAHERVAAGRLGEHVREVLGGLGVPDTEVEALVEAGVVFPAVDDRQTALLEQ